MTQRITIGLLESAELATVSQSLLALGLEVLSVPSTYLPNVLVVTIPARRRKRTKRYILLKYPKILPTMKLENAKGSTSTQPRNAFSQIFLTEAIC